MSSNYSYVFDFEKHFDQYPKRQWMQNNWQQSLYISAVYVFVIFSIKSYMRSRPAYNLRIPLMLWNMVLAVFSILGVWRTLPELIYICTEFGFKTSICNVRHFEQSQVINFWEWAFAVSKVVELGDTLFVVFRKQKLMFLHWYHHITVLVFCFFAYKEANATARWLMTINLLVHSFMYSYFTLKAIGFNVPRPIAMMITTSQMTQMSVFLIVNATAYVLKERNHYCQVSDNVTQFAFLLSLSYLFLFGRFFYNTYLQPKKTISKKQN
ncbi:very long chain fatty acid elongase 6-like [Centruroides vittatus]|uniref:very long chain fatty acid elongase 6-like n=1 Tax=Centruroides vittatus TaxID=120091 RepID=UPI00350F839E